MGIGELPMPKLVRLVIPTAAALALVPVYLVVSISDENLGRYLVIDAALLLFVAVALLTQSPE
jgi:hypothetical protein